MIMRTRVSAAQDPFSFFFSENTTLISQGGITCGCSVCVFTQSYLTLWPHGLWPARLLCPWNFPGKNTRMGCHFLLQGIFLTQGWNRCLLHLVHGQADSLPTALPRKWVQTRSQSSPALFQPRGGSMPQLVDFLSWDWVEISDPDEPCWWSPFQRGSWYTGLLHCPTLALIHSGPSLPEPGLQFFLWSWDPPMSAPKVIANP